jgi:predicted DNA-binding protein
MTDVKSKPQRERLTVQVEPEVREVLAKWADEEGRPVGNLVRRIVERAIETRETGVAA